MSDGRLKIYCSTLFPFNRGIRTALVAGALLLNSGCLTTGDKDCARTPVDKIIKPISIDHGHDVYFNIDDFAILMDPTFVLDSITFNGYAPGKHRDDDRDDDFDFDVNGTKCSRDDGGRRIGWHDDDGHHAGQSGFCADLHKFSLNGGIKIYEFMTNIHLHKGQLRLSLHGKSNNVADVNIEIKGSTQGSCKTPPPPPPPPPPPVAPKTTINSTNPTASPTDISTETITFSADQTGVQFFCSLDGAAAAACSSPKVYSGLLSAPHIFKVYATNSAGLSDAQPPTYSWTVDTQPPTVTITNAATLPSLTNSTSVTVMFTASEASTFSCVLDGGAAKVCSSPYSVSGLTEGSHSVVISAVDVAGNASAFPASYQWMIDLTPPVAAINSVSPAGAINNATQATFQFSANETSSFACSIDNGPYQACQSPYVVNGIAEGSHWFGVRATDVAGNQGLPVSYSWRADFTAPVISIVNSTPQAGNSNAHNVSVDFILSEPASVMCSFDGAAAAACTSPFVAPVPTEGPHSLVISATDMAGNASAATEIDWNMDFTKPILSFGAIAPPSIYKNSPNVSMEILASENVIMSASVNGTSLGQITSPLLLQNLGEGSYVVQVTATDLVGNPADAISYSFTVDLTAPTLSLSAAINGLTNIDSNTLTFAMNEPGTLSCNIDQAGFAACISPMDLSGLADGDHVAQVMATDLAGNSSAVGSVQWTVDTTPPKTTVVATQNGINSFSFALSSSEANSTFVCSLDGAAAHSCSSPVTVSNIAAGFHIFVAQAIDAAGNMDPAGASAFFTVNPPSTILSSNQTANNSITFTFASNEPGSFQCSMDGAVAVACTSPTTVSGVAAGQHHYVVRAVDAAGNIDPVGASATWTVMPPSTSLIATRNNNTSITFTMSSNTAGATYNCAVDGAAAQACTSPLSLNDMLLGNHSILVRAIDSVGNVDPVGASYNWTVYAPITTSLLSESPAAAFTNQSSITFTFSASQPGATFLCSLNGAAATACVSPMTYSGLTDGAKTFNVKAVDQWGTADLSGGVSYSWTVDTVAPTLVSISTSGTSTTITVTWTTNEPSTTKLFWGLTSPPTNVVPEDSTYSTSHSVKLSGLSTNTVYAVRPAGTDRAGNVFLGGIFSARTTH